MSAERATACRHEEGAIKEMPDGTFYCRNCRLPVDGIKMAQPYPPAGTTSGAEEPSLAGPVLAQLSRVQRETVTWLWQDRIPLGRLTGIAGDPGVGKSWLTLALAAAVTTGAPLPGQPGGNEPGNVLILNAEDGLGDTVRPRSEDMGADLSRLTALTAVRDDKGNERQPSLLTDIGAVEAALSAGGYRLVIIDPINAYLGVDLDTHRDAALRAVLAPLAALAERWGMAILFVLHLTKRDGSKAIYRPQGSIAYVAAARVAHLVGINPDDEREHVLATLKNNLAPKPPAIAFQLDDGRFAWRGETEVTLAALLDGEENDERRTAKGDAEAFLRELLSGGPVESNQVQREREQAGITKRTLYRAKAALGVKPMRQGELGQRGGGTWFWALPGVKVANPLNKGSVAMLTPSDTEAGVSAPSVGNVNPDGTGDGQDGDLPAACSKCGSLEIEGYTPEGEARCFGHFVVEELALPIIGRKPPGATT